MRAQIGLEGRRVFATPGPLDNRDAILCLPVPTGYWEGIVVKWSTWIGIAAYVRNGQLLLSNKVPNTNCNTV